MTKEFLMGVAVGAGFGMILAPDSGENTRRKLRQRRERLFRRLNDPVQPDGRASEPEASPDAGSSGSEPQRGGAATATRSGLEQGADQSVAEVLNHARKDELMSVDGIGDVTAKRIIRNRPYETAEEAVQEEVIPDATLEKVKEQLVKEKSSTKDAA